MERTREGKKADCKCPELEEKKGEHTEAVQSAMGVRWLGRKNRAVGRIEKPHGGQKKAKKGR